MHFPLFHIRISFGRGKCVAMKFILLFFFAWFHMCPILAMRFYWRCWPRLLPNIPIQPPPPPPMWHFTTHYTHIGPGVHAPNINNKTLLFEWVLHRCDSYFFYACHFDLETVGIKHFPIFAAQMHEILRKRNSFALRRLHQWRRKTP